jgi:hypothetical protein
LQYRFEDTGRKRRKRQGRWTILGLCSDPIFDFLKTSIGHVEVWEHLYYLVNFIPLLICLPFPTHQPQFLGVLDFEAFVHSD